MQVFTGGMSIDPDDLTPAAIRQLEAEIVSYGVPSQPGNMTLVAYLGMFPSWESPGLPSNCPPQYSMYCFLRSLRETKSLRKNFGTWPKAAFAGCAKPAIGQTAPLADIEEKGQAAIMHYERYQVWKNLLKSKKIPNECSFGIFFM